MTEQDTRQLERIIGRMTDAERRELIDRLARAENSTRDDGDSDLVRRQRRTFERIQKTLAQATEQ